MLDHLVYAAPDLEGAVVRLADDLGVRAAPGGKHTGTGTHNALLALGGGAYLEVIAPDPAQPPPEGPRPFGLDVLTRPRLVTWAMKAPDIEKRVERARARGLDLGNVIALSRDLPDGGQLHWRLSLATRLIGEGLVPFLIDWGDSPHPSDSAPQGCTLLALRAEHPRPELIRSLLTALDEGLPVAEGRAPALVATLQTPNGEIELR